MKYYSEKLDKLFDTEADLQKAESESVSSDPSMKEELLRTANKVNKLSQAYDTLQEEFVNNISEIVNDPVIPTFTEQFRKYIEAENVEDDSDLDPEVVDAFMFLFQVMEDLELYVVMSAKTVIRMNLPMMMEIIMLKEKQKTGRSGVQIL